jgi:putative long chain acyl-CoA synthase
MGLFEVVTGPVGRVARHAQNLLEVARYGGLVTGEEPASYSVVDRSAHHRLRHYPEGLAADAPAIILVPPLMVSTEVFDVSPRASAVRTLSAQGVQTFIVDFGSPEHEPGGLSRTIEDHILAVDSAIEYVREATGRDVHLAGYSQGGMFCYQAAAYRRSEGISSITVFGSPVDLQGGALFRLPPALTAAAANVASGVLGGRSIPGWMSRLGFQALDPVGSVANQLGFLWALHDRDALLPREGQRRFLMKDGWVAFPGPALDYVIKQFVIQNRMLAGGFEVAGRAVSLADLDCPVLTVVGEIDEIAPAPSVRAIRRAAPRAAVYELSLRTGHFGLVVGSTAMAQSWPAVADWVQWREGNAELPEAIEAIEATPATIGGAARERLEHNLELAASLAESTGRRLAQSATNPVPGLRRLVAPAAQVPRLARVLGMRAGTQVSLASAFDDAAKRGATDVGFLFEGNVYDYAAINERVDRVVRGLISDGVTPGERVGVLMDTRPTGLAVITALNRLGAVAVLLRPDSDTALEARLGEITRVITDPNNAHAAPPGLPVQVFLLQGARVPLDGINELEVEAPIPMPDWYVRNAGRANDLAFVLFNGNGSDTRTIRVTNGRWALTAYGTASSAQLSSKDTLLSVSPLHHPAGLLTAIGGAIAGGTRLAWLTELEPDTFWEEVRRYGVTIVSYTWSQVLPLVEAPAHPAERDHVIRLFIGSGLPRGLWRRTTERFAPAGVLEFWGSAERGAILANVSGVKVGSVGRPLPGAATVKLARFDLATREIVRDASGFVVPAAAGELGLMLTQDRVGLFAESALHDVFMAGDEWQPTASLFRRDGDGDFWLEGMLHEIIDTPLGPVLSGPVGAVFEEIPHVTSAVAYSLPRKGGGEVLAVAVSVRKPIGPAAITAAAWRLPEASRPDIVHVVTEMVFSSAGRPAGTAIARDSIDTTQPGWRWDAERDEYRTLTKTALAQVVKK